MTRRGDGSTALSPKVPVALLATLAYHKAASNQHTCEAAIAGHFRVMLPCVDWYRQREPRAGADPPCIRCHNAFTESEGH